MPPTIIIRAAQNELWLNQSHLLRLLPTLSDGYLRCRARPLFKTSVPPCHRHKPFMPATGVAWRWAKIKGQYYYEYAAIPDTKPTMYKSQLPSREELIQQDKATNRQTENSQLATFIEPYLTDYYTHYFKYYGHCTVQQQANLSKACALVQAAHDYIQAYNICTAKKDFYIQYTTLLQAIDAKYMPRNFRCLKNLIAKTIASGGQPQIKLPRSGNSNADKYVQDEELVGWVISARRSGANYSNEHIIRKIRGGCTLFGKPQPSRRWLGTLMATDKVQFLTADGRYGAKGAFGQQFRGYTPFASTPFGGEQWQVDATRVNVTTFKQTIKVVDQYGKEETVARAGFIFIIAVRDVHSGDILGHTYSIAENRWAYIEAIKMAVETANYLPYEIVFDRYPGYDAAESKAFHFDLQNRGVKLTITHKAEGKPQLERWFSTLQSVFLMGSEYYYGEGIKSRRKNAHRSKEYLLQLKKKASAEGWNYDAACAEADKMVEAYRTTALNYYSRKHAHISQSPMQLHQASEKPNIISIKASDFAYLFGLKRKERIKNMGLISFEVDHVKYNYRCADYGVASTTTEVLISYLPEDMSSIHIYELSDNSLKKHLATAQLIKSIIPTGPNAFEGYGADKAIIHQMQTHKIEELAQYKKAVGYDDMDLIMHGAINKDVYEAAETDFLNHQTNNDDKPETTGDHDLSNQYS